MKSNFRAFSTCLSAIFLIGLAGWPIGYFCGSASVIGFFGKIVANSPGLCVFSLGVFFGIFLLSAGAFLLPIKTGWSAGAFVSLGSVFYNALFVSGVFTAQSRPLFTPKFYFNEILTAAIGLFIINMFFGAFLFERWKIAKNQTG